jgi:hypothetical protein
MMEFDSGFQPVNNSSDKESRKLGNEERPMETTWQSLEALFYKKIILYQEVVECLEQERDCLIKTDMEALWEISDKKQSVVLHIQDIREEILSLLTEASVDHHMDGKNFSLTTVLSLIPHGERERFRKPYLSLVNLEGETRQRSEENKRFVEKSLDFLDELIGILANVGEHTDGYTNAGVSSNANQANLLLHKEV